jgi:predicted NAD/FAD-binding protein
MTETSPRHIAVIGAGVSGLVAAHLLARRHRVTLFEADDRPGGHAHTITVTDPAGPLALDTGFLVFNPTHYPLFTRLLDELGVTSQATEMSFAVRDDASRLEWAGSPALNSVFGQRRNLLRPRFWRMLADVVAFGRDGRRIATDDTETRDVATFAAERGYSRAFVEHYLLPLGASLWSCPEHAFARFPIRFVAEFLYHHHMLALTGRPPWRSIPGGSHRYVQALCQRSRANLRLAQPVEAVRRSRDGVSVTTDATAHAFDDAVLAVHADQALALIGDDADETERELLSAFPYQANDAAVHYDTRVLPHRRRCWAAWNHWRPAAADAGVRVTYNLNRLQRLAAQRTWCVTLNPGDAVDPEYVVARLRYHHPVFTRDRRAAQQRHGELVDRRGLSFCGAYWGFGFHEDGVRSACAVAAAFGEWL